ncbi:hypothetical protein MKW92_020322 [Papaver armeniacum]|nr:hypothetical protein MKW92_020322 [Papaver armeniacum]
MAQTSVHLEEWYESFLPTTTAENELKAMQEKDGFVFAQSYRVSKLHTTHKPNFLGLHKNSGFWKQSNFGKGVIIEPFFGDQPFFEGTICDFNVSECNNKLIGAKSFNKGSKAIAPLDDESHGTHTTSKAAGYFVKYVNVLGNAQGTIVGMAPFSHLAVYKICFGDDCLDSNILDTLDADVKDGVDVLSLSLGAPSVPFYMDNIAIGFSSVLFPLIYAGGDGEPNSTFCGEGAFNKINVRGKIVLCERGNRVGRIAKGGALENAGGTADAHVLPTTHLSFASALKIKDYINSSSSPVATILFEGTFIGDTSAPESRTLASSGILKPEIIGPGVSILAAWHFSLDNNTNSDLTYNIISGTSMSSPHLSGIPSLRKSSHPDWSPTAYRIRHVNPSKENDPGLIYDIQPEDYIPYLCGLGYSDGQVGIIAHRVIKCSEYTAISEYQLNYPSYTVPIIGTTMFTRTVTNVGETYSTYGVDIVEPDGISGWFSQNRFSNGVSISEGFI